MRLLVISDIHADAGALGAVLSDADRRGWDEVLFLGDAVGYGSQPVETLRLLRSLTFRAALSGNHEVMLEQLQRGEQPNASGTIIATLAQHLERLSSEDLRFLSEMRPSHLDREWGAVHGALRQRFEYLISVPVARLNAELMEREIYFVGHTHVAGGFLQAPDGSWRIRSFMGDGGTVEVPRGSRAFLNPGSVSLPRDRNPGSCYGIFEEEARRFSVHRVPAR